MGTRTHSSTALGLLALLVLAIAPTWETAASSHAEAPATAIRPGFDNTDVYAFLAPGDPTRLVLAASWIPFENPDGGPNYWEWGTGVEYEIHVDNDGDAVADISYRLTAEVTLANPLTFLYATGPITSLDDADWNRSQAVTVEEVVAGGQTTPLVVDEPTVPANIGAKSTPDHASLAAAAVQTFVDGSDTIEVFAGPTDDPFFADLQIFDLLTLRGQDPPLGYASGANQPVDSFSGFNVHSLVVEVPVNRVVDTDPVIGVWATARPANDSQISRLGTPFFNQLVLPMGAKDGFNSSAPAADLPAYFGTFQPAVEDPEVARLLCGLYDVPLPGDTGADCDTDFSFGVTRSGRGDLFDLFLRGLVLANSLPVLTASGPTTLPAGFNLNRPADGVPAEMLRLNTSIAGATCAPTPSRLGLLGGDACGFPNGRRPGDDVLDIVLQAIAGALYAALDGRDAAYAYDEALSATLTDTVTRNDAAFQSSFPYLAGAHSGQAHRKHQPGDDPIFADGFENGDTSAWSRAF